jgi:hypothetical protein
LRRLPAQGTYDVLHLCVDPGSELLEVHRGDLADRVEPLKLSLKQFLSVRFC